MGHVWLARDERNGLDVALKMVGREGRVAERADREARAAAALRHPRCQRIYALARDSNHVYIAYEYIPGRTLRQAMAARELDDRLGGRGGGADARGARARPPQGDRPPRRQAVERPARRVGQGRRPPARLRARPDGGVRHADPGRRRPRHAHLRLARAPRRQAGDRGGRRLGGRRRALGGARGQAPLPLQQRRGYHQAHPRRRAAARDRPARPASSAPERGRQGTRPGSRTAPARLPARGRAPRGAPQAHGEGEADSTLPRRGSS